MAGGAAAARRSAHTPPPPPVRHPPLGHPSKPGSHQSPPQPETRNPNPIWSSPERRCSSEKKRSPECSSEKKSCPAGSRRPPLGHVFRDGDGTLQYEVLGEHLLQEKASAMFSAVFNKQLTSPSTAWILAGPKDSPYSSLLPSALSSLIMVSLLPADLGGSGSEVEHNRQQQRTPKMPEVEGSTGTSPSV
uniref:Uncharacterized protein n=1 Tax=Setaria viridis TaxID=4556 RepID=A0A4U6TA42_SETVI|nr:protein transport protein sec31-like isoform X3 [Setaria viridis]TKV98151.1 hypothetical protein SEVIR_9G540850v2 [Setaria viridis]